MQSSNVTQALSSLERWVERANWKGYDPFDGLSSPFANVLTFGVPTLRQVWQQGVRRFPFNLRPMLGIKPSMSTKAMGFFAQGYLKLYQTFGEARHLDHMHRCLRWLMENRSPGFNGSSWGNHFAYQHRAGSIPKGTPTIVWTGLIGHAFLDAYEAVGEQDYLAVADSVGRFIAEEIGHDELDGGVYLRYYPGATHFVHNSNVIGASLLARVNHHRPDATFARLSQKSIQWTVDHQLENGAWYYGVGPRFQWIDSFHTGYVLEAIDMYARYSKDTRYDQALQRGYTFFIDTFFGSDGTPHYYHSKIRPLDIQCCSQGIQTLVNLRRLHTGSVQTAEKLAQWTLDNMQDADGHFYYRRYPFITNKTATLHWGQATMFAALATLVQHQHSSTAQPLSAHVA